MNKRFLIAAGLLVASLLAFKPFAPGARIVVLAHNAYPDHGKYADRLDRAMSPGQPFVVEEDLAWVDGKSLLIHGAKNAGSADDPTLDSYFFSKVAPKMEQALKEGNKGDWPLITLYLDIKNDPIEHLQAIDAVLAKYDHLLTKAIKTADIMKQSAFELKPMLVLVEDKQNDIKQQFFYDRIPVGGKIHVFGTPAKYDPNPGRKLPKEEATAKMASLDPEQAFPAKADNYHRWVGLDWAFIEKGGQPHAGEWNAEKNQRLKNWINYGHRLGYFVGVYCLDGFTPAEDQGWDKDYNLGSHQAAVTRWKAALEAKADFISTDQYEDLARIIKAGK